MSNSSAFVRLGLSLWTAVASFASTADPPSFKISQIYSNLDGSTQFIRLTESQGLNGQHHFAGLTLTSVHNGVVEQFTFPSDLPTEGTANLSIVVAASRWGYLDVSGLGSDPHYAWEIWPDFAFPARFIATDGGAINFAGVDEVDYASLPTDGENALNHDLSVGRAIVFPYYCLPPPQYVHNSTPTTCGAVVLNAFSAPVSVIEYYNASLDHYFYTDSAPEIDALDSGRSAGWQRTGGGFFVSTTGFVGSLPVCRYYIPPSLGDSHFFSASAQECEDVHQSFPWFVLETGAAFFVLPVLNMTTGECETPWDYGIIPVYRLWNGRADANHRYTTDKNVRDDMVSKGYIAEGYGPDAVSFCVTE